MSIQDTDLMLVNNGTNVETITFAQLKDGTVLNDSDLFLVNDGVKAETIRWSEIRDSIGCGATPINPSPDEITASPDFQGGTGTEVDPYILQPIDVAPAGGSGQTVELITIQLTEPDGVQIVQWTDNSTGAGTRFTQPTGATTESGSWTGRLVYNDTPDTTVDQDYTGNIQIGTTYFRWVVSQKVSAAVAPEIGSVNLVESNPNTDPRFTSQEFVASVSMTEEGTPVSTKTIDAYVEGAMSSQLRSTNAITAETTIQGQWLKGTIDGSLDDSTGGLTAAVYFNGTHIGLNSDKPFTSADGIAWTSGTDWPGTSEYSSLCVFKGKVYASGQTGGGGSKPEILETTNGTTWTPKLNGSLTLEAGNLLGLVASPDRIIAKTNANPARLYYSDDGNSWQVLPNSPYVNNLGGKLIYGDGVWIYIQPSTSEYLRSTDNGDSWTTHSFTASDLSSGIGGSYGNGRFVIFNSTSGYRVSTDKGLTWEQRSFPVDFLGVTGLEFANGLWVLTTGGSNTAGYYYATIMTSSNLVDWSKTNPENLTDGISGSCVDYGNGKFIVGYGFSGSGGVVYSTTPKDSKQLTIAGAQTDGFTVGMVVTSDPAGGGESAILSVDDSNVTLTDDGTWQAGQHLLGPLVEQANVKKYLKFDNDGNVSDLLNAPQNPAYETTDTDPTLTLKFPATFPSGNAPDDELADGTKLTVEASATNSVGSDGPKGAEVQPSSTTTTGIRSLTEEEFTQQAAKFATYNNRRDVHQGEQAMAQREALLKELQEKGLDAAELLKTKAKRGRRKKAD